MANRLILYSFGTICLTIGILSGYGTHPFWLVVLLATAVCLNPVWSTEAALFFVDGQLYLALLALFLAMIFMLQKSSPMSWFLLCTTIILAYSIKLTGLVYVTIYLTFFVGYYAVSFPISRAWRIVSGVFVAAVVAVVFVNYNPFVTNLTAHGSVFGPNLERSQAKWGRFGVQERVVTFALSTWMKPTDIKASVTTYRYSVENVHRSISTSSLTDHSYSDIFSSAGLVKRLGGYTQLFGFCLFLCLLGAVGLALQQPARAALGVLFLIRFCLDFYYSNTVLVQVCSTSMGDSTLFCFVFYVDADGGV